MISSYFFPFCGVVLIFSVIFFEAHFKKKKNVMKSNLFCYFVAHAFSIIFKNPLPPIQGHENLLLFSSKNFMVLALIFSPFWVNFCIWYGVKSSLLLLHVAVHLSQNHLLKRLFNFSAEWSWHSFSKSIDYIDVYTWFLDKPEILKSVEVNLRATVSLTLSHDKVYRAV